MLKFVRTVLRQQQGYALILSLIALLVISVMGAAIMASSKTEITMGKLASDAPQALIAAQAGIQYGRAVVMGQHGNFLAWSLNTPNTYQGSIGTATYQVKVTVLKQTVPPILEIESIGMAHGVTRKLREQVNYDNAPFRSYASFESDPTHSTTYDFPSSILNGSVYAAGDLTMYVRGLSEASNAVYGGSFNDVYGTINDDNEVYVKQIYTMPQFDAQQFLAGRRLAGGAVPAVCIGGVDAGLGTSISPGPSLHDDNHVPSISDAATLTMNRLADGTLQYVLTGKNGTQTFSVADMKNALLYVQGDLHIVDGLDYQNTNWWTKKPGVAKFSLGTAADNTTNAQQQTTIFCTGSMYVQSSGSMNGRVGLIAQTNMYFLNKQLQIGVDSGNDKSSAAFIYAGSSIGGPVGSVNGTIVYGWERNSGKQAYGPNVEYKEQITVSGSIGRDDKAGGIIKNHPDMFTMANVNDLTWGSGPQFVNLQEID